MFKILFLLVGVAVGFGGGVWWANKNPDQAAQLSAAEEKKFLEAQLQITQKIQAKLDQLQGKASTPAPKGASGFLGSGQAPAVSAADVSDVKSDTQKQQAELEEHLKKLK
jgi:hypothetical protein